MTDLTLTNSKEHPVTEKQVIDYLQKNPEFFVAHPNLLADISLPHESGKAISLVERQVSVLRERNMEMRHRLSQLLDNARENDRLFEKTKRLVLSLLEARDLEEGVAALYRSFTDDFKIHYTSLLLYASGSDIKAGQARVVRPSEARDQIGTLLKNQRAVCGSFGAAELTYLFGRKGSEVGSAAIVPLVYGTTFGLLAIGNRDKDYYRSSMGTLFLSYIAEVLNRTLPRHLPH